MKTAVKALIAGAAGMTGALGVLAFVGYWAGSAMRRDLREIRETVIKTDRGYSDPVPTDGTGDVDA